MADTIEIIGAIGSAATTAIVAGITAHYRGVRIGRNKQRHEPPPQQYQNGSIVKAAADMLEGSTEALAAERRARDAAYAKVEELVKQCAEQEAEIRHLKATMSDMAKTMEQQEQIIAGMRITIDKLTESIKRLESH